MSRPRQQPEPATPQPEPPHRLTLSVLVPQLVAALAKGHGEHSSVELTRNARGDTQIRVSVRTDEAGIDTPEQAAARAVALYDSLRQRYPTPDPANGGQA